MSSSLPLNARIIRQRRTLFWSCWLTLVGLGTAPMLYWAAGQEFTLTALLVAFLFLLLLMQLSYGFTLAMAGYLILRNGGDPVRINNSLPPGIFLDKLASTAIIIPTFNEDVSRVFQGIRVMYESLNKTGAGKSFDFFILSDSNNTNNWVAEEKAWLELCKQTQGFGRIFYRKRRVALHNKSGNVADFCRRWGASFRYMIVLDADSIMSGTALVRLVNLMEANPRVGIIQTDSKAVLGKTLFQRIIQFANEIYGPLFKAGSNYWQLESGNYWGHNAIIRIKPFLKHCAVPELHEDNPLGRRILSHDTVEAALMRRSGYAVWFAYDLEGSYEESPPDLLTSLQRDQRWCFGNLQHIWLLREPGIKLPNRIQIANGIMSYCSSPLWFSFLILSTVLALSHNPDVPTTTGGYVIGTLLFIYILTLLFLPKILATQLHLATKAIQDLGQRCRVIGSVMCEIVFSFLLAPILMFFYTSFVLVAFAGGKVKWGTQKRSCDSLPTWRELFGSFSPMIILVLVWGGTILWLNLAYLPWMSLIFLGPLLSIPFTRFTASLTHGETTRKAGWFVTGEETDPLEELREIEEPFAVPTPPFFRAREYAGDYGLLQVILDPYINAIHTSMLRQRQQVQRTRSYIEKLGERLFREGPMALTSREKQILFWDAEYMLSAHRKLWSSPASQVHQWWQAALRRYNEAGALVVRRGVQKV